MFTDVTVKPSNRRRTAPVRSLVAAVVAVAALGMGASAQAQPGPGPGMEGGGPHGPGMMLFSGPPEHVARAVDHMLDGLNASDAQRVQIKQIATAAAADLHAQREAGRGLRERAMQVFTTPNVDANAAEATRQQMISQQDQASKRVLQAMLDVSRVLTPEQRAKIGTRMAERQAVMQERMERMKRERPQDRPQQ